MKHLLTLILVALSTACGGAEFSSYEAPGAGGDDSSAGTGSVTVTGGGGAGGTQAAGGKPSVGGSSAAAGSGATGGGAAPAACEFDPATLVAALPTSFAWQDFQYTAGDSCSRCVHSPCETFQFTWGTPTLNEDGSFTFLPNTTQPMVMMSFGANDGVCATNKTCGLKSSEPNVRLTVEPTSGGWKISSVQFTMTFAENLCVSQAAQGSSPASQMHLQLDRDFSASLKGLVLPCGTGG